MIRYLDLKAVNRLDEPAVSRAAERVLSSGNYLLGPETSAFEKAYSEYIGTTESVCCGNGLDALCLIFRACRELGMLEKGDEVIVPANTYIATILAITENGLTPRLVEPSAATFQIDPDLIEAAISPRTKAIMIVHLYGRCAYTDKIVEIARRHNLLLFEDNAQAHGCRTREGRLTGSLGVAAAHSFYPGKNLGAFGDGGAVTTSLPILAATVRALANYGSSRKYVFPYQGMNSRIDELQAAILVAKLSTLDIRNARRREIAERYITEITRPDIILPVRPENPESHVWHIFPILTSERDILRAGLAERGVETLIHYPIPPHRQECYAGESWANVSLPVTDMIHDRELSLPVSPAMTDDEVTAVIEAVNTL